MPTVSVIIPAFNSEKLILQTINSVLNQTENDFEIIIIDDGSTDQTADLVEGIDNRVKVIRQENQGIAAARNAGIRIAQGKFITFLDHDDLWHPQKLATQLKYFKKQPVIGCVFSSFHRWNDDQQPVFPDKQLDYDDIDEDLSGWIYHKLILDNWVLLSTAMFKKEVIQDIGNFDGSLPPSDDWDYAIRVSRKYQFCKLKQVTTLYRIHTNQTSLQLSNHNPAIEFRKRTIQRYGFIGPDGSEIDRKQLDRYFFKAYLSFGHSHYKQGNLLIALQAFIAALKRKPFSAEVYFYLIASTAKIAINAIRIKFIRH